MICIVSHDAGGAELLASFVGQQQPECRFVLGGPAVKVFQRRLGDCPLSNLDDAIAECEWVLCGTSWQSDLEWQAMALARKAGKRSVAFLDHWSHYRERFVRDGQQHLPDEIWVGDEYALAIARDCLPVPVRLVPNPFFTDLKRDLARFDAAKPASEDDSLSVLFVCEPLSEHGLQEFGDPLHWGYTEHDAIRYFMSNLDALGRPVSKVVIRPHPSEAPDKYEWVRSEYGAIAVRGGTAPLLEEIAACDVVVGCESMAMVVGIVAGKRVISCIPDRQARCSLPYAEIEMLHLLDTQ